MDKQFITSQVEAFLFEKNLYKNQKLKIECINDIIEIFHIFRELDFEMYQEIYDDRVLASQLIQIYLEQVYQEQFTDDDIIEESIIGAIIAGIAGATKLMATAGAATGAGIGWGSGIATAVAFFIYPLTKIFGPITKASFRILRYIGEQFERLGKSMIQRGRYWKFRYNIINENARQCYIKCGFDPKDFKISGTLSWKIGPSSFLSNMGKKKDFEQADCLQNCYINFVTEHIALKVEDYLTCLKRTSSENYNKLNEANKDKLFTTIASVNLGASCDIYREELNEMFDMFETLMKFISGQSPREGSILAEQTRNMLKDKIFVAKKKVDSYNNRQIDVMQKNTQPRFNKQRRQ